MFESPSYWHRLTLRTSNPEEACGLLGNAAVPYRSRLVSGSLPFSTEILILKGRSVVVSTAYTIGKLLLRTAMTEDSFGVVLDLGKGVGPHHADGNTVDVCPDFSFIQNPSSAAQVTTQEEYRVLFLRFAADELKKELERRLVREVRSQLTFQPRLDMRTAAGQRLRSVCEDLRRTLCSTHRGKIQTSSAIAHLESEIMTLLLEAQPHNYSRMMNRYTTAGTWQVRAAEEYMHGCAHLPLSLGDICVAAGVNARTLQHSFQRHRGCSPIAFLQRIRMEAARADLLNPGAETTVASQAAKWGFFHFGRFSISYHKMFGERPSETLRRSRKRSH